MTGEPTLELHLHGPPRLRVADRDTPLEGLAALIAAVLVTDGPQPRATMAALLWPEVDTARARANLRQRLLRLRQQAGADWIVGDAVLQLAPTVQVIDGEGVWLQGVQPADDEPLARWLEQARHERQQRQVEQGLRALREAEAQQRWPDALAAAQRLLAVDPLAEAHHRALIRVHYLMHDMARARLAFQGLQALLDREFDATPSTETLALMQLVDQAGTVPAPAAGASLVALQRPPRLAGRAQELQAVQQAWAEGRAVLLRGEAGMGKSRLLAECLQGRTAVLTGAGRPGDGSAPYSTLARWLRPLLAEGQLHLATATGRTLAAVLGHAAADSLPALRPGELQAAVAELLSAAALQVVALDDLHFADAATIDLVAALIAGEADADTASPRRCWLLAQRPAEAPAAAQTLLDSLTELHRLTVVPLRALDPAATQELIATLGLPVRDVAHLSDALTRHCGGNPLFLLETLKHGLADGSLAQGRLPRPGTVGTLIERRLERLSEPALNLARVAAIAGVDFRVELAEAALAQPAMQLASAWHELQQAQVLRDEGFAHDLVADAVLRGVPQVVARRVHAQCAAWLQAQGGEPARVARHWREGGRPAEAARAFEHAAQRAHATARLAEEAELYLEAAAAHADAGQPAERFEALALRVSALVGSRADDAAVAEARALAPAATSDLQRVRAARVLADLLGQRGPFDEALAVGREGIALAKRINATEELVRLSSLTAGNLCKIGQAQEAYTLLLPLREWVDASPDDSLRHVWYGYWAAALGHTGRLREGVAAYDTAAAAAQRQGDRPGQSMALLNQCVVLRTMGALERAFEGSRLGLALAPDEPGNTNHALARLMHARNEAEVGLFGSALAELEALLPQFQAMGAGFWVWATRGTLARLWQHLGQHARALQLLHAEPAQGLPAWMQAGLLWIELEVAQWCEQAAAPKQVEQALALMDADPHRRTGNQVRGLRFAAPAVVCEQASALAAHARQHEQFGVLAALHLHHARAASAQGCVDEAATAAQALVQLLDEGFTPEFTYLPEAWLVASEALQRAGQPEPARRAQAAGVAWVQQRALPQVPPPFIDSFMQRNPVNRALLTGAVAD